MKICTHCQDPLPLSSFRLRKKRENGKIYEYRNSYCIGCESTERKRYRTKAYRDAYKARRRAKNPVKFHMQERISQWRHKDPDSDLTVDYLIDLYQSQQGKCYYSGEELVLGGTIETRWCSASLDRLSPSLGYKQGNVVWCTYKVNTMKGSMDRSLFFALLRTIVERDAVEAIT